ncbi:MAG: LysM peptidoglycan-binding domain-containing protein [Anaerolineae bacterium]|nr:LysM peptidoglycan-binding domain-containing protein [Anaerolineae bacterium]
MRPTTARRLPLLLIAATLACSLGAVPTTAPTLEPTATTFIIVASPIVNITPETATSLAPTSASGGAAATTVCRRRTDWIAYRVLPGDTLGTIAARAATTIATLTQANCLSNPNYIEVGWTIYVPRVPMTVTPGTPRTATASVTPGGGPTAQPPAVQTLLIQPAIVQNQQYNVIPGAVTLIAQGVSGATKVTFYAAPTSTIVTPTELGTDTNLADGAAITWNVPNENLSLQLWAVATNATNQTARTPPIVIVYTKAPTVTQASPATAAQ